LKHLLEGADYFVYLMPMPKGIYACVVTNPDGTYSIYLDPRRSFDQLLKDLDHELNHIIREDFYNGLPIYVIEAA
jgi:hypothetical protein